MTNLEKYRKDIKKLIENGETIFHKLKTQGDLTKQKQNYEIWYSEALYIIKIILFDRLDDFKKMYYNEKTKNGLKNYFLQYDDNSADGNWLDNTNYCSLAKSLLDNQLGILKSCEKRFESSLFDIKQLLQADLFDSEIKVAEELNNKGFIRAAGAIAGVVLEAHLSQVCNNHSLAIKKKDPTINDFNEFLKSNNVIEISIFRTIQFLGDLRNKCDHKKSQEPTKEEIQKLIDGVNEIIKTLF